MNQTRLQTFKTKYYLKSRLLTPHNFKNIFFCEPTMRDQRYRQSSHQARYNSNDERREIEHNPDTIRTMRDSDDSDTYLAKPPV